MTASSGAAAIALLSPSKKLAKRVCWIVPAARVAAAISIVSQTSNRSTCPRCAASSSVTSIVW
ncbi:MAG: hypothetical protein R3C10_12490 [Pirellulales bacterium]